ncbi:hypothetical protein HGP16_22485 [Rhizobium sp. P40RR-XXII]|uniref:hypothetical protein n=1 Tax=unclassified Rhizobium TaxID=2613769 RepID=UPI0014575BB9|nr:MULTISPECIES: hypothetical protein [unclassified Rhizobium]NLR85912.1 hypothetical protein [Rhizobium sp. P28RR-XV]NLS19308.1 hypothetical protein [Rhizobium sp. P40RR-XXII]
MRRQACLLAILTGLHAAIPAAADDSGFLKPLNGSWTGTGKVLRKIGSSLIGVSCWFNISAPGASISMTGNCRGLLIINRAISAQLTARGTQYSGTYTGPSGATSQLSGSRQGDVINLSVRWARLVNGDRDANMTIDRQGSGQLTLRTVDKDQTSGKAIVTSEINLRRQ